MILNCPIKCFYLTLPWSLLCRRHFSRDLNVLVRSQPTKVSTSLTLSLWCSQLTTAATHCHVPVFPLLQKKAFVLTWWGAKCKQQHRSTTRDPRRHVQGNKRAFVRVWHKDIRIWTIRPLVKCGKICTLNVVKFCVSWKAIFTWASKTH